MSAITRFLPKNHLSYIMGQIAHIQWPSFLNKLIILGFAKVYHINLDEAELPLEKYSSLGDFFVRKLKSGIRPIGETWAVHPADSMITQTAKIRDGKLIQAKNKTYTLESFLRDKTTAEKYYEGVFITYYLGPTDYHRVHSPVSGEIVRVVHIPGTLWPVNSWSTENIHEIFSVNERVFVEIKTDRGFVGVMFVGATNVGQIILSFDEEIIGNQLLSDASKEKNYVNIHIKKGDELGMFRMGSTVVVLYSKNTLSSRNNLQDNTPTNQYAEQRVWVNSNLI